MTEIVWDLFVFKQKRSVHSLDLEQLIAQRGTKCNFFARTPIWVQGVRKIPHSPLGVAPEYKLLLTFQSNGTYACSGLLLHLLYRTGKNNVESYKSKGVKGVCTMSCRSSFSNPLPKIHMVDSTAVTYSIAVTYIPAISPVLCRIAHCLNIAGSILQK